MRNFSRYTDTAIALDAGIRSEQRYTDRWATERDLHERALDRWYDRNRYAKHRTRYDENDPRQ